MWIVLAGVGAFVIGWIFAHIDEQEHKTYYCTRPENLGAGENKW